MYGMMGLMAVGGWTQQGFSKPGWKDRMNDRGISKNHGECVLAVKSRNVVSTAALVDFRSVENNDGSQVVIHECHIVLIMKDSTTRDKNRKW